MTYDQWLTTPDEDNDLEPDYPNDEDDDDEEEEDFPDEDDIPIEAYSCQTITPQNKD